MLPRAIRLRLPPTAASTSRGFAVSAKPPPHIPVIRTLAQLRRWRKVARDRGMEVGCVPTMGALHQGHLDLVKTSLSKHPFTVMTLFVNPMQFAPTEDLSKYPRTMDRDLDLLRTLLIPSLSYSSSSSDASSSTSRNGQRALRGLGISEFESFRPPPSPPPEPPVRGLGVSENDASRPSPPPTASPGPNAIASGSGSSESTIGSAGDSPLIVFAPGPDVMYPLKGELQDLGRHKGVTVDVKGWGDVMEGSSRPQFFKGVATVCTKIFNAVEPDHAYFGQKDIQQALLMRIMLADLLMSHPTPENLHIQATTRDPQTHLALSSRNAYLSPREMQVAPTLYKALSAARELYETAQSGTEEVTGEEMVSAATGIILQAQEQVLEEGGDVELRMDYVEVFDPRTFEPVRGKVEKGREMVVAGAIWVGGTRLIDNLLLGWRTS